MKRKSKGGRSPARGAARGRSGGARGPAARRSSPAESGDLAPTGNPPAEAAHGADADRRHRDVDTNLVGITYDGKRFKVPKTEHAMSTLLHLNQPSVVISWLGFTFTAAVLVASLDRTDLPDAVVEVIDAVGLPQLPKWSVLVPAVAWRVGYNVVLGGLLRAQSKGAWLTRYVARIRRGSLSDLLLLRGVRQILSLGPSDEMPPNEFVAWVVARQVVNVVLPNDVVAFAAAALRYLDTTYECAGSLAFTIGLPEWLCNGMYVVGYVLGIAVIYASVLSKIHSHRVIGEYAWHWGDFFFLVERETELKFDGIYEMAPHPMYSAGYGWSYGAALLSRSWTVLAMALGAHLLQLGFLAAVETPHIEKLYGGSSEEKYNPERHLDSNIMILQNFNMTRAGDWSLVLCSVLLAVLGYVVSLPDADPIAEGRPLVSSAVAVATAIMMRVVSVAVIGLILHYQGKQQFWTKRYVETRAKHLPPLSDDEAQHLAFAEWRPMQNMLQGLPFVAFIIAAIREYEIPTAEDLTSPYFYSLNGMAAMLVTLSVWAFQASYSETGDYAWFYGDFFTPPPHDSTVITYDGAYRFLNHPDVVLGFMWTYGVAIAARSWPMAAAALVTHGAHVVLLLAVELPHSKKLYKNALRKEAALTRNIKKGVARARGALLARLRLSD